MREPTELVEQESRDGHDDGYAHQVDHPSQVRTEFTQSTQRGAARRRLGRVRNVCQQAARAAFPKVGLPTGDWIPRARGDPLLLVSYMR